MKNLFLFTILASAQASHVCGVCRNITQAIDHYDPITIAASVCPLAGELYDVCEDILPPVVEWMQSNGEFDMICTEICASGEDYDYFGDYNDLHHPFDIPHEEPVDLHESRHEGHHPFDIPHEEPVDLHESRHEGHHPFDIPHGNHPPHGIISVGEGESDIHSIQST